MGKHEIMTTRLGELLEMIDCYAIAHGAEPAGQGITDYDAAIGLR